MARAMYDYTLSILEKVSFDVHLFTVEFQKALKLLLPHEIEDLKVYVMELIKQNPQLAPCLSY